MKTQSSYRTIHILFMLVLLLQIANGFLLWLPQYVRLILNQLLFVFLPAYLFLRLTREPLRERVRWTWPGWKVAALSLLIGMALYPLAAVSGSVLQQLLGYSPALPDDVIPTTALMGVLAIVAYAVMAPLCEEFLFRGVLQPVYERRGPAWGVGFVGGLFVIFHLSLLQGISIIPLALALGFVNDRARSLPASILTHFGANALAALVLTDTVFPLGAPGVLFSAPVLIGSPIVALLALVAFTRLTRRTSHVADAPAERAFTLSAAWPLLVAGLLYVVVIGVEIYTIVSGPGLFAAPLALPAAEWQDAAQWQYEIYNPADEAVGDGECLLTPVGALIDLACTSTVRAYEVRIGDSFWSSAGGERRDHFRWRADDGSLISGQTVMNLQDGAYHADIRWTTDADGIHVRINVRGEPERVFELPWSETPLADDATLPLLTDYAAPWQLAAIELKTGMWGQTARFHPFMWRQATQDNGPVAAQWLVMVTGRERIDTPAGAFHAWKVAFGTHQTVWLDDSVMPTRPVRFFNGVETWALKENY
jgi:membrane protease YdiL (CAAX protease family)